MASSLEMREKIAVIILNYFGFDDTAACIDSVHKKMNAAIFLVDNSANPSERNKLSEHFEGRDHLYMLFPSENIGFAAGVNQGLEVAIRKGFTRFLLLNNDAVLLAEFSHQLEKAFERHPGALISMTIRWNNQLNKGYYYHKYFGLIVQNNASMHSPWLYFLSGCALAFDKEFIRQVGKFNEIFFMYGEDVELCYRAHRKKVAIVLLEDVLIEHAGSHSSEMASFFYEYHLLRSHFLLCFLLFNEPLNKLIAILGKAVILLLRSGYRCVKYRSTAPLFAYLVATLPLKIRPKRIAS